LKKSDQGFQDSKVIGLKAPHGSIFLRNLVFDFHLLPRPLEPSDHPNPAARYTAFKTVPRKAWTLTVPAILSAKKIFTIVPAPQKADAVKKMWEGPITSACPSSALRQHRFVRIYLDRDSAALLR